MYEDRLHPDAQKVYVNSQQSLLSATGIDLNSSIQFISSV
jgi:hypothetical protein